MYFLAVKIRAYLYAGYYFDFLFAVEFNNDNYAMTGAESIEKARVFLNRFKPDLVILDLYLNGFFGLDLLEEIKLKYPDLPVIIVTAYDNFIDDQRIGKADAYFVKNFRNMHLLSRKVNLILNGTGSERQSSS